MWRGEKMLDDATLMGEDEEVGRRKQWIQIPFEDEGQEKGG